MNERIKKLRTQSLQAINKLSPERAQLVTEFYKSDEAQQVSIPVKRALTFKYILENKKIHINEGELIVGERGPAPKETPTYPEVSLHSLQDLHILNTRPKVWFRVDDETNQIYENQIIPFWKGKTQRDKIFEQLPQDWKEAYTAGMFTEFQEQRAPGHTVAGKKIFQKGMLDLKKDIQQSMAAIQPDSPEASEKMEELKAMDIAADALILFAARYARELDNLALQETDKTRKAELIEMARICRKVPAHAPETFHEMLQHYWFVHVGVITELNPWDSFNPGRLDQHLYPFYKKETESGILTKEWAIEILQSFWVKFNNHPSPPKMGVTALESNTYTDFALINLGGVKEDGTDAVNELTYILLDVIEEMRILQPSSMVQVSEKNPDSFVKRAVHISKTGFGQPSYFNTDAIVKELVRQGKSIEDARNGGASGCVETGAFGTESYILTGYFNLTKILEVTLHNGVDPVTGKKIGIESGNPATFKQFSDVMEAFKKQLHHFANIKIKGNLIIEKLYAEQMPVPFLSLIIDDCIANAKDYNAGGARYNTSYVQGVGLGSITDSLTAIKYHVFDQKNLTMYEMLEAIKTNFVGYEELRHDLVYETPKYGNDDDYADAHAVEVFNIFYDAVDGLPTARGGVFRINMLPTTSHVYFGSKIKAMPDGRKAFEPLSEGISPFQGADKKGPTAVIKSASKIDHIRTGGTLLNQKFSPSFFKDESGITKLTQLIRSYFKLGGHHIQFNVVNAETLREAQRQPEKYSDLIVRVAGYSDYFNDLGESLQEEIIRRTEHEVV
ncbi:MAG TPA: formate C-acetyltransferase/glycerol dehydratase family glycyl radical enzyme [Marinilabiliales bacterium]|nr:MAG: glycyl radical enzyme [Bacteroidetes bacterium GWA2_40_14]OFX71231.1 MAG: glycyl radical enzyme [Bacteroidetes bacterium GWD2_40_43]OFX90280.1 MAG: glycyl radical enzyme [Bacteroidetes bacterium GWE2_40_63]OFY22118.1 MAG: glycyl radical enzyme [Bacteroidetes bacterium GWF2_40_13]OFZ27744.1 MAG: glycyl radical enzyme [Bacteroidetes bacterium RIFOXYC2_FULL_40_12]HAM99781.1 formate C-acetyltransferase/glycerol dehydratase family glycyl radical enzyme [Marinilabiliales bacterium]